MIEDSNYVGVATFDHNFQMIQCNDTFKRFIEMDNKNEDGRIDIVGQAIQLCRRLRDKKDSSTVRGEYKMNDAPFFFEVSKIQKDGSSEVQYNCHVYNLSKFFLSTLYRQRKNMDLRRGN